MGVTFCPKCEGELYFDDDTADLSIRCYHCNGQGKKVKTVTVEAELDGMQTAHRPVLEFWDEKGNSVDPKSLVGKKVVIKAADTDTVTLEVEL
jgi:DNA-directed RNA polymerase subunit RPC12/RpoP